MHGMLTASSIFWFTPVATGTLFLAYVWLVATAMWLLVGAVAADARHRLRSRQGDYRREATDS